MIPLKKLYNMQKKEKKNVILNKNCNKTFKCLNMHIFANCFQECFGEIKKKKRNWTALIN